MLKEDEGSTQPKRFSIEMLRQRILDQDMERFKHLAIRAATLEWTLFGDLFALAICCNDDRFASDVIERMIEVTSNSVDGRIDPILIAELRRLTRVHTTRKNPEVVSRLHETLKLIEYQNRVAAIHYKVMISDLVPIGEL